jgi:undecaprenyl-diphosphatase
MLASCFGLGRLPYAPGTWGSLPATVVFGLMYHFGAPPVIMSFVMAALAVAGSVICVKFAPAAIKATGKSDPGEVVADELAGQAVTFVAAAFFVGEAASSGQIWAITVAGFLLFRMFDIAKPWPIHKLEKLPEGWGILADDLLAGVFAAAGLLVCSLTGLLEYVSELVHPDFSSLNTLSAAFLGAVQGLTEFLPVSSSGHLVLFESWLELNPEESRMLLFDLATHIGTLLAIFVVFHKSIVGFVKGLLAYGKYGRNPVEVYKRSPSVHLMVLACAATVVTGTLGMLLKDYFVAARDNLTVVALMWLVTGTLLLITDWRRNARVGLRQFALWQAVVVGLAQSAAIMPGISRSGATICVAILLGLRRRWAIEFSFLLAMPAILGATAIELAQNIGEISSGSLPISSVLTGMIVAAAVGVLALKVLIKTSMSANLKFFAFYCYILACLVLTWGLR